MNSTQNSNDRLIITRIHEQMYLGFNQQNKNWTQNIMWQLLWLNMTLRQHEWSDLHLDFCVFFLINILEENLDLKVQHKKIMTEKW